LARLAPRLAAWLYDRHLSAAIDAYSVDATERVLEDSGFVGPRQVSPPAIAFVDLTGFTQLAEERGDQVAASLAMQLATLAEEVARRHAGRVVKLLGDGVLLRFNGAVAAAEASLELLEALSTAGLPRGHVGVDAGPLVVREGDIFGRTVNLASRLSDRAEPGEVLVSETVAAALPRAHFRCEPKGSVDLQGIPRPIKVFATSPATETA
jgi:class 3 adenylate cyclase